MNVADTAYIKSFAVSPEVLLSADRLVYQSLVLPNRPKLAVTRGRISHADDHADRLTAC